MRWRKKGDASNHRDKVPPAEELDFLGLHRNQGEAPDLTRRIMGQLGYMQVGPRVARRHRIRRIAGLIGTLAVAVLALSVGMRFYENGSDARRPAGVTIPAAIGNDVQRQQNQIGNVIRSIRNLSLPPRPLEIEPAAPDDDSPPRMLEQDDHGSTAPFRWV